MKGLITQIQQATAKNGQPYVTLTLTDTEGKSTSICIWNSQASDFHLYKLATIQSVKESSAGFSATPTAVTLQEATYEYMKFIPKPPTKEEWDSVIVKLSMLMDSEQKEIFKEQASILYPMYCKGTAAKKNHHNFIGGLALHTYEVLKVYSGLYCVLPFYTNPFIVSMALLYHDYYKLYEYDENMEYTKYISLVGHVHGSAECMKKHLEEYLLPNDLILHIEHCILAHHGKPEWGSLVPATPEAFVCHECDMLSGVGVQYANTQSGERSWGLGTTVYHYES